MRTVSCVVALAFVGAVAAAQRVVVEPPAPKGKAPAGENRTEDTLLRGVEGRGPEVDSKVPDELREDPKVDVFPGDECGTTEVPAFLKGNPYRLAYVGGTYTPAPGERLDPQLAAEWRRRTTGRTWGFVMFQGRITTAKRNAVEATGVRLDNHHTFNCMSASIPFSAIGSLLGSSAVRWVGQARPWQKVEPSLLARAAHGGGDEVRLIVKVYESDLTPNARKVPISAAAPESASPQAVELTAYRTMPEGPLQRRIEGLGARVVDYFDELRHFVLEAPLAVVQKLAESDFVHWIEADEEIIPAHDRSTRQIHVDYVRSIAGNDGSDTVVGMMDSGMGLSHTDVNGKWYAGWTYNNNPPVWNDPTGHGTHVMGTICGRGVVDDRYRGCAPAVGSANNRRIYVAKIFGGNNGTSSNAISAWARFATPITVSGVTTPIPSVTNHSWGIGTSGMPALGWVGTDATSIALDFRVFYNRQTQVVAAHNQGGSSYANQTFRRVLRPAVAKLSLSVANAVSHRESDGGMPGRPHFSSNKGPTGDNRFCPHVMAPGRIIRSVRDKTADKYVNFSGTSMATPHVAGAIAGLMEHYPFHKTQPAVTRAVMAARTNPYEGTRTWTTSSDSYYNRQGMGMIDAYKSHYQRDVPGGHKSGRWYGTFTRNTAGWSADITVPADATRTFFVLTFDEKPASEGAKRACIHDLDLHIDVEPFTAGYNTGEFMSARAWDTWDWYGNVSSIAQVRGKKVRLKINPRVRPTGSDVVRFGLAYMIPRGDTTPTGTVSISAPSIIKPGQTATVQATVNVPAYMQTNTGLWLRDFPSFAIDTLSYRDRGNLLRNYTSGPDNWTMGLLGDWFSTSHRRLEWKLEHTGTAGNKLLRVQIQADNRSVISNYTKNICVDGAAPFAITGLTSSSHTPGAWSNDPTVDFKWNAVVDSGCAGVNGLGYTVTSGAAGTPNVQNLAANTMTRTVALGTSTQGRYFNLRAWDKATNAGGAKSAGPYLIDTVKPAITSVLIDNGAGLTTTLAASLALAASDAHSGIQDMRRSGNGIVWSPWSPFQAGPFAIDLSQYGGGTGEGVKTVFVQVRDKAGNVSPTQSDRISYMRCPQLRGATPSKLENVGKTPFVVTGADLAEVFRVIFGGQVITSTSAKDWATGYFKVVDDNTIHVFPPQGFKPGSHGLRVESRICRSNEIGVGLVCTQGIVLEAPDTVTAGKPFRLMATKGGLPASTLICLAVSPSNAPTTIPGIVSFEIGNNFAELILLPMHGVVDPTSCVLGWTLPSLQGMANTKLHFETYLLDLTKPSPFPLPTSNVATVAFD